MVRMKSAPARRKLTAAMRLARKAWQIQYLDSTKSGALADQALTRAQSAHDVSARGWAHLVRGFHRMRHESPTDAMQEFALAEQDFSAQIDRRGHILVAIGVARCLWTQGQTNKALDLVLPLRTEGLRLLRHEERGMLLNTIAGCYSTMNQSAEAFAYMFQALRESVVMRGHGFDVVLYNNLAHELYQLGDYHEALNYVAEGLKRCAQLKNARLNSVLLTNRVACLTDLGRPGEALRDIHAVLAMPETAAIPGLGLEAMSIAALRAGALALGTSLLERARLRAPSSLPDVRLELDVAEAESLRVSGKLPQAIEKLEGVLPLPNDGLSLRAQCLFFQTLADAHELLGHAPEALAYLRQWERVHLARTELASKARYQAAALQTELLRMQRERDEIDDRRRATERARAQLEAANQLLAQKVLEVQGLQEELKQQAVRDVLTGLFNRRHLNHVLPTLLAQADRDTRPLSVAIIDLDHFKAVNDQHGHLAGDEVLRQFGRILAGSLRKSDVACRYGGEEFCLLLPRTAASAARRKVLALLRQWRAVKFNLDSDGQKTEFSAPGFSAGIADSRLMSGSPERMLKAADHCALEAKRIGRGCVVLFAGTTVPDANSAVDQTLAPQG